MDRLKLEVRLADAVKGLNDARFLRLVSSIHVMSTPRIYSILNAIVSCMDEDELYVEVGTYQGGSLISALMDNNARAIGVDNFAEFKQTNSYERTLGNLQAFNVSDRAVLRDLSYQEFFKSVPADFKMQVYYYDGEHNFEGQLAGMEAGWQYLSAGSIMLVDDYLYPEVSHALNAFISNHKNNLRLMFVTLPFNPVDMVWWNGCVVMEVI
jgi:hypothetical protein